MITETSRVFFELSEHSTVIKHPQWTHRRASGDKTGENLLSLHAWSVKLMKIPTLVSQSVSNWTILKAASIINSDQCRLIVICFLDFQSPILGTTKYIVYILFHRNPEITIYKYLKKNRTWPSTLTEWLRATSGSEYSQMHTARFNLTYALWVIGLTARCYMLVSVSIDMHRSITRLITNKPFWYVSYLIFSSGDPKRTPKILLGTYPSTYCITSCFRNTFATLSQQWYNPFIYLSFRTSSSKCEW